MDLQLLVGPLLGGSAAVAAAGSGAGGYGSGAGGYGSGAGGYGSGAGDVVLDSAEFLGLQTLVMEEGEEGEEELMLLGQGQRQELGQGLLSAQGLLSISPEPGMEPPQPLLQPQPDWAGAGPAAGPGAASPELMLEDDNLLEGLEQQLQWLQQLDDPSAAATVAATKELLSWSKGTSRASSAPISPRAPLPRAPSGGPLSPRALSPLPPAAARYSSGGCGAGLTGPPPAVMSVHQLVQPVAADPTLVMLEAAVGGRWLLDELAELAELVQLDELAELAELAPGTASSAAPQLHHAAQ
jgi:hypothetical protein